MNFARLFKFRLVVARFGEMDAAEWWNTTGVLARLGTTVLNRGFPKTDLFAQARAAFEVARHRSREVFNPPGAVTLWDLPMPVEDVFESEWRRWCLARDAWGPFVASLQGQSRDDLFAALTAAGLVGPEHSEALKRLRRGTEGRSVPITGHKVMDDQLVDLLALGFCRAAKRELVVPFATQVEVPPA